MRKRKGERKRERRERREREGGKRGRVREGRGEREKERKKLGERTYNTPKNNLLSGELRIEKAQLAIAFPVFRGSPVTFA